MSFRGYRVLEVHRFAVHLTTKTAQNLLMKAFIGTSGRTNALAERSIWICGNVAESEIIVVPQRRGGA